MCKESGLCEQRKLRWRQWKGGGGGTLNPTIQSGELESPPIPHLAVPPPEARFSRHGGDCVFSCIRRRRRQGQLYSESGFESLFFIRAARPLFFFFSSPSPLSSLTKAAAFAFCVRAREKCTWLYRVSGRHGNPARISSTGQANLLGVDLGYCVER